MATIRSVDTTTRMTWNVMWATIAVSRDRRQKSHPNPSPPIVLRTTVRTTNAGVNPKLAASAGRCPIPKRTALTTTAAHIVPSEGDSVEIPRRTRPRQINHATGAISPHRSKSSSVIPPYRSRIGIDSASTRSDSASETTVPVSSCTNKAKRTSRIAMTANSATPRPIEVRSESWN